MLLGPGLTIGAFIFSDDHDRNLGLLRDGRGGTNAFRIRLRIWLLHFVLVPTGPALLSQGDLAAFGVKHFRFVADALADAFEDADLIPRTRIAAVAAEVDVGSIRAYYGNGFQFLKIKGKKVSLVPEQNDRLLGDLQCQFLM